MATLQTVLGLFAAVAIVQGALDGAKALGALWGGAQAAAAGLEALVRTADAAQARAQAERAATGSLLWPADAALTVDVRPAAGPYAFGQQVCVATLVRWQTQSALLPAQTVQRALERCGFIEKWP